MTYIGVRVYPVRLDFVTVSWYVVLGFLTLVPPGLFVWGRLHPHAQQQMPAFLLLPWLLVIGWNWVMSLRRPHRIELHEPGTVVFVPKLGEAKAVNVRDITAIRTAF